VGQLSLALSVAPPEEAEALAAALLDVYEPEPIS
jgi:hypothetical protein